MSEPPAWLREKAGGVEVLVRLVPRASRNRALGVYADRLKIQLTAPPVEGAANRALVRFLAEAAGVARGDVCVAAGTKSRSKTVMVATARPAAVLARLAALGQPL